MQTHTSPWKFLAKSVQAVKKAMALSVFGLGTVFMLANTPGQVANAATVVMDFTGVTGSTTDTSFSQNGITMTATRDHFDYYDAFVGGAVGDPVAAIHNGNGGEEVSFSYVGGAFNLLSVDVTGFLIRDEGASNNQFFTATFESNLGGTHSVTGDKNDALAGVGVIDFAALGALWSGITSFTISVPFDVATCLACDIVGFDDITISDVSAVPIPAALPLFLSGLLGLRIVARRKRQANA